MWVTVMFVLLAALAPCGAQPKADGDYLIPVDHVWGLPRYLDLKAVYPADYFPLLGALYRGYIIIDLNPFLTRPLVYTKDDLCLGVNGYWYASGSSSGRIEPLILILGGDMVIPVCNYIYTDPSSNLLGMDFRFIGFFSGGSERAYEHFLKDDEEYGGSWEEAPAGLWDDGLETISTWSTLTETVKGAPVTYHAGRMRFPFYRWADAELNFSNASLFWAEGERGSGVGGTIEVAFKRSSDHVMILNGAVDLARLSLYKDNNRLKRVLVRGDDGAFAMEYGFEDSVQFHKLEFPSAVRAITITILEVYKGARWDDTCVTAIFLKQPRLRPRVEYEAVVESYIRLRGMDRLIEDYERSRGGRKRGL